MNNWVDGIQNAIAYIEDNLTEKLEIKDIASKAYVSEFHFQRIFSALCGFTVSEYIRNRRLTLAAEELSLSDAKVIDVAMKYGYDSHDSFTRAFTKFHGISPKAAKEKGAHLKSVAPLRISLTLKGGTMMDYRIVEKEAFTVMGRAKKFDKETSYDEIPKYWQKYIMNGECKRMQSMYGVCMDGDGEHFEYLIACNYQPWNEVPDDYVTKLIPAGTWAVFPCKGAPVKVLQNINTQIWTEWLPNCKEYKLAGNYNLEVYLEPKYSEIWFLIQKI